MYNYIHLLREYTCTSLIISTLYIYIYDTQPRSELHLSHSNTSTTYYFSSLNFLLPMIYCITVIINILIGGFMICVYDCICWCFIYNMIGAYLENNILRYYSTFILMI